MAMTKFDTLSELSKIKVTSRAGISPPFCLPLSDLLSEVAIEQSKDYSSFAQPNIILALQVTITNYIMFLWGELQIQLTLFKTCLFNWGGGGRGAVVERFKQKRMCLLERKRVVVVVKWKSVEVWLYCNWISYSNWTFCDLKGTILFFINNAT